MTTGDIVAHLQDMYGSQVSKDLVSRVTDAVVADLAEWANRPLDPVYPVLLIDCIFVRIRDGQVANRPIYVAMGISVDGERDVLGMWTGPTGGEGAKVWLGMLTELKNRGVKDVLIACCDGLKGLPDAIVATWPQATVQTWVVHLIRNSLRYASKKDWSAITAGLKPVYTAPTLAAGEARFVEFAQAWRERYPAMVAMWERSWTEFVPFLDFPVEIRKLIYTTDDRVSQRPVPGRGPPPRALPDRAGRPEDPVPDRPREETQPNQPHRQDQRLEVHPEHRIR